VEHFAVVQSIIRAALVGDRETAAKQAERLRLRLEKAGETKEAETIDRLVKAVVEVKDLRPSHIEVSRALVTGERLTKEVHPPMDRETGAKLCTIHFLTDGPKFEPVHNDVADATIAALLAEWSNATSLHQMGVEPTRSLLIFGPPGSGKTLTAHYVAQRLSLPLLTARIDGLVSSFLGTTARNIANLFEFANRYACVLLLDEFDALAKVRDDPHEVGEIKRVVNTLLQNLDARRTFGVTIAITNHDRLLDPAVWRRFETQIHMGAPGDRTRGNLLRRFLAPIPVTPDLVAVFSYCLDGHSGADLQRICDAVKRLVAISNDIQSSGGLFRALAAVLSRLPSHERTPAAYLARDPDWFISYAANDKNLQMTQEALGETVGKTQYQVSRLKTERPYLKSSEGEHAQ
jgi:SpoVK/Ycf46/Vps4 family AAA+-type ATPase